MVLSARRVEKLIQLIELTELIELIEEIQRSTRGRVNKLTVEKVKGGLEYSCSVIQLFSCSETGASSQPAAIRESL